MWEEASSVSNISEIQKEQRPSKIQETQKLELCGQPSLKQDADTVKTRKGWRADFPNLHLFTMCICVYVV